MNKLTFVYAYWHKASESQGEELRWSIRSIKKYFQGDCEILIVGSPPPWYEGKSIEVPRIKNKGSFVKFRDQINKLVVACGNEAISDPFVWIMDDCYLNGPVTMAEMLYPKHTGHVSSGAIRRFTKQKNSWRTTRCKAFQLLLKSNRPTYDFAIHLPQPIHKTQFLQTVNDHDLVHTGVNWEILYLNHHFAHAGVNARQWASVEGSDRSTSAVSKRAHGKKFVFNRDIGFQPGLIEYLRNKFPTPSPEEGSVSPFVSVRHRNQLPNLLNHLQSKSFVEVGVRCGANFKKFSKGCPNLEALHAVDVWESDVPLSQNDINLTTEQVASAYEKFQELKANDPRVVEHKCFSVDAAAKFEDDSIDFVYLDGDHTRKGITEDIAAWYPKVRPGGVLSGHDYIHPDHKALRSQLVRFEVKPVVDEFVASQRLKLHRTKERYGTWLIQKPMVQ